VVALLLEEPEEEDVMVPELEIFTMYAVEEFAELLSVVGLLEESVFVESTVVEA